MLHGEQRADYNSQFGWPTLYASLFCVLRSARRLLAIKNMTRRRKRITTAKTTIAIAIVDPEACVDFCFSLLFWSLRVANTAAFAHGKRNPRKSNVRGGDIRNF